jgi:hypothetical protein
MKKADHCPGIQLKASQFSVASQLGISFSALGVKLIECESFSTLLKECFYVF